jgi:hypothetical protein
MSTVPSGKKRNIDLHIFPKERTPLHSRFNEKEWKSPKRNLHSFFILFCCKFFIFRYFHKFMFRYHSKKYRPVSTHKKAPLSRCFTDPRSGMPPVKENFSLYFSAKPPRKIMQSIVFYISAPPDMIDKII